MTINAAELRRRADEAEQEHIDWNATDHYAYVKLISTEARDLAQELDRASKTIEYWKGECSEVEHRLRESQAEVERLRSALSHYARRYETDTKECWNWKDRVCDSYSGSVSHFDWNAHEQEEPWEIAEKALEPSR